MKHIIYAIGFLALFTACETPYAPETSTTNQEYVVEGYVEVGNEANPTYVMLTKSLPFIGEISSAAFESAFVHNATIMVNDGDKDVTLTELCLDDLPENIKQQALTSLGLDSAGLNICLYVDIANAITREVGRTYNLTIKVEDKILTATTTIPAVATLSDFTWEDTPGVPIDTLAQLMVNIVDPPGKTYYRYFTKTDKNYLAPFQSTADDVFFEGKPVFQFPLNKAERRDNINFDTFGYYTRGDSVHIKWCSIDKAHFDFWQTKDFSSNSGGPFSSYTRIKSNINGGLGIWGGYAISYYHLYCPPK